MTASGAPRTDASGTCERPEPSVRPARAGLPDPFRFRFAARLPRLGLRGALTAALVLLAFAALAPPGPAQAQEIEVLVNLDGGRTLTVHPNGTPGTHRGASVGLAVYRDDEHFAFRPEYQTRTQTFTIRNTHSSPLSLTGTPRVSITGASARDFRVVTQPPATVPPGGSVTFDVEFKPEGRAGVRVAKISIPSNDRRTWTSRFNPFVFDISGVALKPISLTVNAVHHKDGGLQVGWSESQEVINLPGGRRWGIYRVFHRRSGSGGAWTRSAEIRKHSHRIAAEGIDPNVQYEVRVEAYDGSRQGIADGTTTSVARTAAANRKPFYPGLPSEFFVEFDKQFSYVLPKAVDPDGDAITFHASGEFLDGDGDAIGPPFYDPTTRSLKYREYSTFAEYKAAALISDPENGGIYTLTASDSSGQQYTNFRVWWIVPLKFSGNPSPRDLQLERGKTVWTSLPGAYRGEPVPDDRITRDLHRVMPDGNFGSVPPCDGRWFDNDWICFNPADGDLRITTAHPLAQTTSFRYRITDNDPPEEKSSSRLGAFFTIRVGADETQDLLDDPNTGDSPTMTLLTPPHFGETLNGEGPAQSATVGETFSYTAPEATNDDEGETVTYTAALEGGGALPGWLAFNATTRTFSGTPDTTDAPAQHTVVMTATDDGFIPLSGTWTFTLSVSATGNAEEGTANGQGEEPAPAATPPTAEAGANLVGKRGGDVKLKGSGTKHAEGSQDALTYSWRIAKASHPELKAGTSWLTDADKATAIYSVPRRKNVTDRRALNDGQWINFELTVTDGDGETATDTVRMTIRGSTWKVVSLSVADASAQESSGSIGFTVSLSEASRDPVSVDYATSNGTALAGSDYTSASGTLTIPAGQTSKTVTVTLLDDVHDENTETFTLTLSNPSPAKTTTIADATATGSIKNADPLQRDWLARFGRAAASDAIAAITGRMETPRGAGSHFTLGGHRMPLDGSGNTEAGLPPALAGGPAGSIGTGGWLSWSEDPRADASRTMDTRELLMGTSFRAVLGDGAGPQFTSWGQGASVSHFSGAAPGLSFSGDAATGTLGMDYESGNLLAGLAMTHSLGEGTAQGAGRSYAMGSTVTTALPYARLQVSDRISAWGLAGTGAGQLSLDLDDGAAERYRADLSMTLAAAGVRGELLTPAQAGGFALAVKADAFWVRTESDSVSMAGVGNLAATQADASRMRAVLDGSRTFALAGGGTLTPSLELGVRQDGGDAETGTGMEFGAGIGYADTSRGLDMALRVHGLAAHDEDDYGEWGVSGTLRLVPDASGRGISMSLTPSYGADPGGSERLWMQPDPVGLAANDDAPLSSRFDAEVGYGTALFDGGFTGTPNVGLGLSDTARELRMGWRMNMAAGRGGDFELNLDVTRREDDAGAEHGIGARLTTRW